MWVVAGDQHARRDQGRRGRDGEHGGEAGERGVGGQPPGCGRTTCWPAGMPGGDGTRAVPTSIPPTRASSMVSIHGVGVSLASR